MSVRGHVGRIEQTEAILCRPVRNLVATAISTTGLPAIVFNVQVSGFQAPARQAPG